MISIDSKLEGKHFELNNLEHKLKSLGFTIGGNWDYDHGFFDYLLNDKVGYQYLRIPFQAIDGELDSRNCKVKIGNPLLLSHKYQLGLDDHVDNGNLTAPFNQFSEPVDSDASFPEEFVQIGQDLVYKLEQTLL